MILRRIIRCSKGKLHLSCFISLINCSFWGLVSMLLTILEIVLVDIEPLYNLFGIYNVLVSSFSLRLGLCRLWLAFMIHSFVCFSAKHTGKFRFG